MQMRYTYALQHHSQHRVKQRRQIRLAKQTRLVQDNLTLSSVLNYLIILEKQCNYIYTIYIFVCGWQYLLGVKIVKEEKIFIMHIDKYIYKYVCRRRYASFKHLALVLTCILSLFIRKSFRLYYGFPAKLASAK